MVLLVERRVDLVLALDPHQVAGLEVERLARRLTLLELPRGPTGTGGPQRCEGAFGSSLLLTSCQMLKSSIRTPRRTISRFQFSTSLLYWSNSLKRRRRPRDLRISVAWQR